MDTLPTAGPVDSSAPVPLSERFSPVGILAITVAGIFMAEVVAMVVIFLLPPLPYFLQTLVDAVIMTVLIFPLLYYLSFRPLLRHIVRHKEATGALQQAYDRLRELEIIVNHSSAIAFLSRAEEGWPVEYVSDNVLQLGYSPQEFLDGRLKYADIVHPQDLERISAEAARYASRGEVDYSLQYRIFTRSGDVRWLDARTWVRRDARGNVTHYQGVVLDVTEKKQAEEKVRRERNKLKSILDAMNDGVYIINQQYDVEYVNPIVEEAYGKVEGRKCYQYLHERTGICPWCPNPGVFEGKTITWEWHSDRTNRTYEFFDTPLKNADGTFSKLKIFHDVTHRQRNQEQLEQTYQELLQITRAEQKQRRWAEALIEATSALNQTLDLDLVTKTTLEYVGRLVPYDRADVVLLESESRLILRATCGPGGDCAKAAHAGRTVVIEDFPYLQPLLQGQEHVSIADTQEIPGWQPFNSQEGVRSWLGIPLVAGGKPLGFCSLDKMEPDAFSREHFQLAEALVSQTAVAIQNAWLFEQLRASNERLHALSRRLVEVQESERHYIARELHDEAGQALTGMMMDLRLLEEAAHRPQAVLAQVAEMENSLQQIVVNLQRLAMALRPATLDHLGLEAAVRQNIEAVGEKHGVAVHFKTSGIGNRLPKSVETILYRIIQEALTNAVRHSQATRVDVLLKRRDHTLAVLVEDNGVGFDPAETAHERLGLLGMRERAEMLGGDLFVESGQDKGTTIVVEIPYDDSHSHS